ncbi:MAG: tetratricopeptide repeat protein [Acidobacteria bacterium]|nr:tetratricopeptide repeat protein [Acidobacteriota bacterium]
MRVVLALWCVTACLGWSAVDLEEARDRQDRAALEAAVTALRTQTEQAPRDAAAHYRLALAASYLAEAALEARDRPAAKTAAETGIRAAERAVELGPGVSEHHRILGALCGQIIPANVLLALRYGECARRGVEKALELEPQSAKAWLSRGVGHYYLPPAFGGGVEAAIRDFEKALELDARLADAHLWLGIALRKAGRAAQARRAITRSLELNPRRAWARQQLEKTPAP